MARAAAKTKTEQPDSAPPAQESRALATTGPKTVAQERKEKTARVAQEIMARPQDFATFLEPYGIKPEFFSSVVRQTLIKNPDLLNCSTASLLQACSRAAMDGLPPDGRKAAIVKFSNEATYMPMAAGLLEIAYETRDGDGSRLYKDINHEVVYEGEQAFFEAQLGDEGYIKFNPPVLDRDPSKEIVGAFCIIRLTNGGVFREIVGGKELKKIAAVSRAKSGPNKEWPAEMARKGVLRRLLKRTPRGDRMNRVLEHDEENYVDVRTVDEGADAIPDDKLFDDTAHQPALETQQAEPDPREAARATARIDLMDSDTEEKLDATVAKIEQARGFFGDEITDGLLANAEQLRLARFGGAQGGEGDGAEEAQDGEFADMEMGSADTETETADVETVSDDNEDGDVETAADAAPADADVETQAVRPTGTAGAPNAEQARATPASATDASGVSLGATSTPGKPAAPSAGSWKEAPADRRVTPAQALLDGGVHFKSGIAPNGHGQVPMFSDETNEIVGWAKPDLDIPTLDGADVSAKAPETNTSAEPVKETPQIRSNPEDRSETFGETVAQEVGAHVAEDAADDGYGEPAAESFKLKTHPAQPPREYADPVEWRDAIIFKMSALKEPSIHQWWKDNRAFVEAAVPHAKQAAGKVILQAVVRKLAGAKEMVEQWGPFQ